jgi:hypothetical protein
MIAVAGGILLAFLIICVLVAFALMTPTIFRTIGRRGMAYNISNARGLPPGRGKRWIRIVVMFVVLIGVGYFVNKVSQHSMLVRYSHDGEINGGTPN